MQSISNVVCYKNYQLGVVSNSKYGAKNRDNQAKDSDVFALKLFNLRDDSYTSDSDSQYSEEFGKFFRHPTNKEFMNFNDSMSQDLSEDQPCRSTSEKEQHWAKIS